MHRRELNRLMGKVKEGGTTLVPLSIYFSSGKVKVELALARGKKAHDKREALKEREAGRDIARALSAKNRAHD